MKVIRKYTALQIDTDTINKEVKASLNYGKIEGPYYDETYPEKEFDSEQEAIEYAYKKDSYAKWLIVPVIRFDNHK